MNNQQIGGLLVQLAADVAALKKDMTEAEKIVDSSTKVMAKSVDFVKGAFAGLAGALSVGALVAWTKAGIDAADATKQFSQKTGVAAEDVAGLQLAFKQGGVEASGLQSAIAKMSKQMAEGSDGFKSLGVETRNADGSLRSAKSVLYDVADATAGLGDGLERNVALQQIFGKSAADLIPTLLEGSDGLKSMAEMAEKLGLVISTETADRADKFNDTVELLGMGLTGVGRQIAAQLLPTLNNLAESFLMSTTEGDRLTRGADILASALKGVYSVVLGGVEIFSTVGKVIGGVIAAQLTGLSALSEAVVKVFQGDFGGAAETAASGFRQIATITKETGDDISNGWQSTGKAVSKAWDDAGGSSVSAMTGMEKKGRQLLLLTKDQEEAAKKAGEAEAKRVAEYQKTIDAIDKQTAAMELEAQTGEKLTTVQKQSLDLMLRIQNGTLKLTEAEKKEVVAKLEMAFASEENQAALAKEKKMLEQGTKENERYADQMEDVTAQLQKEIAKQKEANLVMGMTTEAVAKLEIARLEEQAVAKDRLAVWAEESMLGDSVVQGYREQAAGLRELAKLKGDKAHLAIAKEAGDAWKKTSETIGASFTDSLFRAFEQGKSFGDAMMDSIKNLFKSTILQVLVKPVQQGMNSFIGSAMSSFSGGSDDSGGGGSGILSSLGSLFGGGGSAGGAGGIMSSIGGLIGATGSGFGAGLGATLGGVGTMGGLSAGASLMGTGTAAGMLSGGAMMVGAAIPWVAVAMAVAKAMEYKVTPDGGGITASLTSSGTSTGKVGSYQQFLQEGGLGGGGNTTNREWSEANTGTTSYIIENVKANTEVTKAYARSLGLNADAVDGYTKNIDINTKGMDEAAAKVAIDAELAKFATEQITFAYGDAVKEFALAGESVVDTFRRLASIEAFSHQLNEFGGVFSTIATSSIDARQELMSFAGGIEAFAAMTQQYVNDYYTEAEKFGMQAQKTQATLQALGVDPSELRTKADYRALVESQDLTTSGGREAFAALLELGPMFAQVSGYLEKNNITLGALAQSAPATAVMENIFKEQELVASKVEQSNALTQAHIDATVRGSEMVTEAVNKVVDRLGALTGSMNRIGNSTDQGFANGVYTNGAQGA